MHVEKAGENGRVRATLVYTNCTLAAGRPRPAGGPTKTDFARSRASAVVYLLLDRIAKTRSHAKVAAAAAAARARVQRSKGDETDFAAMQTVDAEESRKLFGSTREKYFFVLCASKRCVEAADEGGNVATRAENISSLILRS